MILVTGSTGFTGSHFMKKLEKTDHDIRCFVRSSSDITQLDTNRVELAYGSFEDEASYKKALEGVDILINIASIGFGHADVIVREAEKAGVRRAIFVSTTALFTTLPANTKSVRLAAEKTIMESSLDYTIIRPTMIYGTEKDRNMVRLVKLLNRYPILPVAGNGKSLQQPIYVDDLAEAIMKVISNEQSYRKAYNVSGKVALTYNDVVDITAEAIGKKVIKMHVPVNMVLPMVGLYNRFSRNPRIKVEQILRLNEDKAFDHSDAALVFGFTSRAFEEGIHLEVKRMKELGII
jgi:nucleoside-diphosphate-sugar epimerase